ncbi:MAG: tRNA (adenosine(37)-N6)-threonylcarbamoyltransferase complex ATPase subunit type 1 TsaE [Oscillospiraceae bacterium]|jgi:tRNA threonylcarbamoyladenosine biosynthesis protein TsaE|nr:tRNA (adenosine(37)-N6)-threonylcarbamoyltransferase complex ATPase subunit type 1 TsaE [Oscillospiraceae bacterium]
MTTTFHTHSELETEAVGRGIALKLAPGAVIALSGELGAGKTAFTRGAASALGSYNVSSPTFTIVNEYLGGTLPLFHFDFYRLSGEDEVYDIGWDDYLERGGIIIAEWSTRAPGIFNTEDTIYVDISIGEFSEDRVLRVTAGRNAYSRVHAD